jgi:hypothetical protein
VAFFDQALHLGARERFDRRRDDRIQAATGLLRVDDERVELVINFIRYQIFDLT